MSGLFFRDIYACLSTIRVFTSCPLDIPLTQNIRVIIIIMILIWVYPSNYCHLFVLSMSDISIILIINDIMEKALGVFIITRHLVAAAAQSARAFFYERIFLCIPLHKTIVVVVVRWRFSLHNMTRNDHK